MSETKIHLTGLTDQEVLTSKTKHGLNKLTFNKSNPFQDAIVSLIREPMVLLLLTAACIYFITGNPSDGIFMTAAIMLVSAISLFQDSRSRKALEKLKEFSRTDCKAIRNGSVVEIKSEDIVMGDSLIIEEGVSVPADGVIIQSNDFSVNESILTGESLSVYKDKDKEDHFVYSGTIVSAGLAIIEVTAIGNQTKLGKIGKSLENIKEEKTPLELQIGNFIKKMVVAGFAVFFIVWAINYFRSRDILDSLLKALTLAMSILPEEIPVAFATFMALGAWRLMKMGIVVKQMKTVETLGSATIICTDKTGTITENKMSLARIFLPSSNRIIDPGLETGEEALALLRIAMWASEPIAFDPMEIALHQQYTEWFQEDERAHYKMIHEYQLGGKPPMMTHIFENDQHQRIIAAKGAPEALMAVSGLKPAQQEAIKHAIDVLAREGYRILGVGEATLEGNIFPERQQDLPFVFKGLLAFYDPPKQNIKSVLESFYQAGIRVKIITGDNALTTKAIAKQIGLAGYEQSMSGDELMHLPEKELKAKVAVTQIFSRMFPEAKLKIINALKANGEIVAMTGDGVNDGPALKAAHIGIAMGQKGTEIAKQAASLILLKDDLARMLDAIAMGRRIYTNLKKAIRYIISIHIPIILTVFIPLALGWVYPNIFSPVHIIFLELIMGPTCSIIYENEPVEPNAMLEKPRPFTHNFFNGKELLISIVQGLVITAGTLLIYKYAVGRGYSESLTRTMVFAVLITANIFLTLVNRSFYYPITTTLKYKNNLVAVIICATIFLSALLLYVPLFAGFFKFEPPDRYQLLLCLGTGFFSVIWFEAIKYLSRKKKPIEVNKVSGKS